MKIKLFNVPNLITLCNLLCGVGSIVASLVYHDLTFAFALIMAGATFDFFDGFAARLLNQYTAIGVQLDSLADMVSFGTAPAAALFTLYGMAPAAYIHSETIIALGQFLPFIIPAFSALRLAKFNVDDSQHESFSGLTTTANGIFCSSFALACSLGEMIPAKEWIVVIALLMSFLMISPIRMFSFKTSSFGWKGNELRYCFVAVCLIALLSLRIYAIPLIIVLYIVLSTILWIIDKSKH